MPPIFLVIFLCVIGFTAGFLIMFITQRRRGKNYHARTFKAKNILGSRKTVKVIRGGKGATLPTPNQTTSPGIGYDYRRFPVDQSSKINPPSRNPINNDLPQPGLSTITNSSSGKLKCPYCQQLCEPSNAKFCPVCNTAHHKDCWHENGGCTRLSCSGKISGN